MSYSWLDTAKEAVLHAEEKVKTSETLLGLAEKAYEKNPSRINRINLQACRRLHKESQAMLREWEL